LCADEGFGTSGRVTIEFGYVDADRGNAVVRVPGEDRLYVIGQVTTLIVGDNDFGIACLLAGGAPCADFGNAGRVTVPMDLVPGGLDAAIDGAVLPWGIGRDWRLVVVGQVERLAAGDTDFGVALLRPDGSLESASAGSGRVVIAFDEGADYTDLPAAVAVDSLGRIVVGGTVDIAADDTDWGFTRLNSDLSVDTNFGSNGRVVLDVSGRAAMHDMLLQPDGKIVAVGSREFGDDEMVIVRLNATGSTDTAFGSGGQTAFDFDLGGTNDDSGWAVTTDPEGRFVMVGQADSGGGTCWTAARVLSNGQPDTSFYVGGEAAFADCLAGASISARDIVMFSHGGGMTVAESNYNGDHDFAVIDWMSSLSGATLGYNFYGFDLGGTYDDRPRGMLLQPDGKIVVAGRVVGPDDTLDFGVLRIWSRLIFADGFEAWGSAAEWDSITTAP
jgi:uncharacterized delta-60 repeat protein